MSSLLKTLVIHCYLNLQFYISFVLVLQFLFFFLKTMPTFRMDKIYACVIKVTAKAQYTFLLNLKYFEPGHTFSGLKIKIIY